LYIKVIVPLAVPNFFTYYVPEELQAEIEIGKRVEVQFGAKRIYAAVVAEITQEVPKDYVPKPINSVLDEAPILSQKHLQLWNWIAHYYLCHIGEVMLAALPASYKLTSETKVSFNENSEIDLSRLNDNEFLVYEALQANKILTVKDIKDITSLKSVYHLIKSLISKQVIEVEEELIYKYKPKYEDWIIRKFSFEEEDKLHQILDGLNRAKKQQEIINYIIAEDVKEIAKKKLLFETRTTSNQVNALVAKGLVHLEKRIIDRVKIENTALKKDVLTEQQKSALKTIKQQFQDNKTVLLFGVTSSGKTQVYTELIKEQIKLGKQVLYLLPEIALTNQIIKRLKKTLNTTLGVYHSNYNSNNRLELWQKVLKGELKVVVGARSAVFLPFTNLGLIIVDEEYDGSFKQFDPAPRYNARDLSVILAHISKANLIFGAASPSLEIYTNALNKKYALVEMKERFGNVALPEIEIIDLKDATRKNKIRNYFTLELIEAINETLAKKEQVIIFQNRRGYAPAYVCDNCAYPKKCVQCDVTLTYHKYMDLLVCHLCHFKTQLEGNCKQCNHNVFTLRNFGTEQIEEIAKTLFDEAKVARMDADTSRSKSGRESLIEQFENNEINILVGTQMVTKGFDFDNVSLVAVLNADAMLHFPDFRATERVFQQLMQVSGRAGRRNKQGRVFIQSYEPSHLVFKWLKTNDYKAFYDVEIMDRSLFNYPPYSRFMQIQLKHKSNSIINKASDYLANLLRIHFGQNLLGPSIPFISYVRNYNIRDINFKLSKNQKTLKDQKQYILEKIEDMKQVKEFKSVIVRLNVDV